MAPVLRDAGGRGNNCMLLSVLAAAGLPPDASGLRGDIADAINAMNQTAKKCFLEDVVDPVKEIPSPDTVLGPTFCKAFGADRDWAAWSTAVRTGSDMLGAAELHVLRALMQRAGVRLEATSVASLDNKSIREWAVRQTESGPVILIVTDGTHYNWVDFQAKSSERAACPVRTRSCTRLRMAAEAPKCRSGPHKPRKASPLRASPVIRKRGNVAYFSDYIVPACALAAVVLMAAFTSTASRAR